MPSKRYLFYISQNYSFEILRPLQEAMISRGDEVKWFVTSFEVNMSKFTKEEVVLKNIESTVKYHPDACFVPGNIIPDFIPGIKVHVFHGLEWKKKGHFVIRDCFDLYCTHGIATTVRFKELADKHQFFDVVETGWPKLDNLFTVPPATYFTPHLNQKKPAILFAPTFSPSLTSAPILFNEIAKLIKRGNYNWIVKFHPKMDKQWIEKYKTLISENFKIIESRNINELLQWADIMISDTSSVIGEFSLLGKPVIALNNSNPGDYLLNISEAEQLSNAITAALSPDEQLKAAIDNYAQELHPYRDGQSSTRILDAVEHILSNGKSSKKSLPINLFRNLKQRRKLKYWRW